MVTCEQILRQQADGVETSAIVYSRGTAIAFSFAVLSYCGLAALEREASRSGLCKQFATLVILGV